MVAIIADTLTRGRQSWCRTVTAEHEGHKVRVVVERDAYDFQSRIYSEIWSPKDLRWNRVQTLSGTAHKDLPSMYHADDVLMTASTPVTSKLFEYAWEVVL